MTTPTVALIIPEDIVTVPNVEIPETLSCPSVPTEVSDELVTPLPKVVLESTSVPLILYVFPTLRLKFSLDFNELLLFAHCIVFLIPIEPIPIPAPSRSAFVPTVVAIPTLKSASSIVVELTIN